MQVRHFDCLSDEDRAHLFDQVPQPVDVRDEARLVALALGATLYLPGTRPALAEDLRRRVRAGVTSAVVCLEDAIGDDDVAEAEVNVVRQLTALLRSGDPRPLLFVRVRSPEQLTRVAEGLGEALCVLSGFVVPKFTAASGLPYLRLVEQLRLSTGLPLSVMPIMESREVIHRETRTAALTEAHDLLQAHRDVVLAVRVGTTDLSSVYGLRRGPDLTVYDVGVVAQVLSDVVNVMARADGTGFVVCGPVWEYFGDDHRLFKPMLRESPFQRAHEPALRTQLLATHLDGLVREVVLDRANGMSGKTVIHPSHVMPVHALSVVSHEDHQDAVSIDEKSRKGGGVSASGYRNKMNEAGPHRSWAAATLQRAHVFGVAREGVTFVDLLAACTP
ncbi:HpcH/HpaI aldolase/citrate lyase family protein [Aquipuribacter hungaricus]|uniref:HpcH/HpaI aldolase/citrate lyase family protein n=1 Tax=Aquipuribacter hungaricus TaxID=545624 RepID=A0ABV7WEA1_9MICO